MGSCSTNALACDIIVQTPQRAGTQTKPTAVPLGSTLNMQFFLARSSCLSLLCWVWFSSFLGITEIHLPEPQLPCLSRENGSQDNGWGSLKFWLLGLSIGVLLKRVFWVRVRERQCTVGQQLCELLSGPGMRLSCSASWLSALPPSSFSLLATSSWGVYFHWVIYSWPQGAGTLCSIYSVPQSAVSPRASCHCSARNFCSCFRHWGPLCVAAMFPAQVSFLAVLDSCLAKGKLCISPRL